jgi:iron complex outermembrane recepter protein
VSYAKGFSAPRTDNLYSVQILDVQPETTDSYDLGYRYQGSTLTASAALWQSDYENRIVSAFDPDLGISVDRNIGAVDLWGFDGAVGFQVIEGLSLYGSLSYIKTEVQSDIQNTATQFIATAGKELVETPEWTYGARAEYVIGPVSLGLQGKYVDKRWATDVNDQFAPAYFVMDADVRYDFQIGNGQYFVQLNAINLLDEEYLGSIATSRFFTAPNSLPLYAVGAPQTFQLSFNAEF